MPHQALEQTEIALGTGLEDLSLSCLKYLFICLAAPGLSCSLQEHAGSLAVARELLVAACGI